MACYICENIEAGDTLYISSGLGFDYIRDIQYCPVCGRKLAEQTETKQGEWIGGRVGHGPGYICSICGYGVYPWNNTNYCPNCGARMKGADDAVDAV